PSTSIAPGAGIMRPPRSPSSRRAAPTRGYSTSAVRQRSAYRRSSCRSTTVSRASPSPTRPMAASRGSIACATCTGSGCSSKRCSRRDGSISRCTSGSSECSDVRVGPVRGDRLHRPDGGSAARDEDHVVRHPRSVSVPAAVARDRKTAADVLEEAVNVARLKRALRRSPRYLAWRLLESARHRTRRPWSEVYPRLVTERALLAALGAPNVDALWSELASAPFFVDPRQRAATAAAFARQFPGACAIVMRGADAALAHEFDLLGSGPCALGPSLPWHTDFKTGREWPMTYSPDIAYAELDRPSDVKVPWELSRCQHFTRLGQAYWLTGDERYAAEFVAETSDWIAA